MKRTTFRRDQMRCLHPGNYNSLFLIETATGPREVVAHNPEHSNGLAAKMMVLWLKDGATLIQQKSPANTLPSLLETIRRSGVHNFHTLVLAADKPVTYFDFPQTLSGNYQLEFPGGVAEGDEDTALTAVREAVEECGLDGAEDIIQTAPLVDFFMANDAGTNAELFSTHIALVRKKPKPPPREGVIPEKCWLGPLLDVEEFLIEQGKKGVVVELLAHDMIQHLCSLLLGGWDALRQ